MRWIFAAALLLAACSGDDEGRQLPPPPLGGAAKPGGATPGGLSPEAGVPPDASSDAPTLDAGLEAGTGPVVCPTGTLCTPDQLCCLLPAGGYFCVDMGAACQ
jgi:hypothetical protein